MRVKSIKAFSILNVIFGLLVCAFILYLLIPCGCPSKEHAKSIVCKTQMKSLVSYDLIHFDDNNSYPPLDSWCDVLKSYCEAEDIKRFQCLCDEVGPCSYAMNENIPAGAEKLPDDLVVFFESAPGWNQVGGADDVVTDRHGKPGANIAFSDGHVEFVRMEDISNLRWTFDEQSK